MQRDARRVASSMDAAYDWPRTLIARGADALRAEHLRRRPREALSGALHCFLLDCSASMVGGGKLARAKGVLLALMEEAYRRRDRVSLLSFGGREVRLRVPPSRARMWNEAWIAPIGGGGGTPLQAAVQRADGLLARSPHQRRCLWLLTDGRTLEEPPRPASADAACVIDLESAAFPLRRAEQLAAGWQAQYVRFD